MHNNRVALIDYGVGNICSITNALAKVGCGAVLTRDRAEILAAQKIILPGVGSFPYCMQKLKEYELDEVIKECVVKNKSILGICVGMQMLFDYSEEHGGAAGLGIVPGKVVHFDKLLNDVTEQPIRLPHIEWSNVQFSTDSTAKNVFSTSPTTGSYYFVHSYVCIPNSIPNFGKTSYAGATFCSAVLTGNICGVQFHPEKSGRLGLDLLTKFVNLSIDG